MYSLEGGYQVSVVQALLAEVIYPLNQLVNVIARLRCGAGTQRNYAFATIGRVLPLG